MSGLISVSLSLSTSRRRAGAPIRHALPGLSALGSDPFSGSVRRRETSWDAVREVLFRILLKLNAFFMRALSLDIFGHGTIDCLQKCSVRLPMKSVFQPPRFELPRSFGNCRSGLARMHTV